MTLECKDTKLWPDFRVHHIFPHPGMPFTLSGCIVTTSRVSTYPEGQTQQNNNELTTASQRLHSTRVKPESNWGLEAGGGYGGGGGGRRRRSTVVAAVWLIVIIVSLSWCCCSSRFSELQNCLSRIYCCSLSVFVNNILLALTHPNEIKEGFFRRRKLILLAFSLVFGGVSLFVCLFVVGSIGLFTD